MRNVTPDSWIERHRLEDAPQTNEEDFCPGCGQYQDCVCSDDEAEDQLLES